MVGSSVPPVSLFQSEIFLGQFEIWNEMEIKRQTIILAAMMLFDEDGISNMDTEETSDLKKKAIFSRIVPQLFESPFVPHCSKTPETRYRN